MREPIGTAVESKPAVGVDGEALLTVEEVANFLRVPVATLYAWRHKHVGPPALRIGRHLRYRVSDVHRWLRQR